MTPTIVSLATTHPLTDVHAAGERGEDAAPRARHGVAAVEPLLQAAYPRGRRAVRHEPPARRVQLRHPRGKCHPSYHGCQALRLWIYVRCGNAPDHDPMSTTLPACHALLSYSGRQISRLSVCIRCGNAPDHDPVPTTLPAYACFAAVWLSPLEGYPGMLGEDFPGRVERAGGAGAGLPLFERGHRRVLGGQHSPDGSHRS